MAALLSEFEYDIFISYRQNDNKYDGWVTEFVENLQKELEATIKANISVYFDENPHDGLLDTHQVDESLAKKLKCLIFIPIISMTYCDTTSFAWQHEFVAFKKIANDDSLGMFITLPNGNVCSRVLPIKIHSLDQTDQTLLENELGGALRSIDFIHQAPGVNRPLDAKRDDQYRDGTKAIYRDQINKVANSIKEILIGIKSAEQTAGKVEIESVPVSDDTLDPEKLSFGKLLLRRSIPQAFIVYFAFSVIVQRILASLIVYNILPAWVMTLAMASIIIGGIIALGLAWFYEFGPEGLMRTSSWESRLNPYPAYKRKPFTGLVTISALTLVIIFQAFYFNYFPSWFAPNNSPINSKTIAVMPFKNLSDSDAGEYFIDGLTTDITTKLSKVSDLIVIDSKSTIHYKADTISNKQIGKDLGVSVLLKGTYRHEGDMVRVTGQLIDVESSQIIWADAFDRAYIDLLALQSEMSLIIASFMEAELTDREKSSIEKRPTNSMTAYEHYSKGRSYYNNYEEALNDSAIIEFKAAIELDSNYALAWAGLGDAFSQMHIRFGRVKAWNDSSLLAASKAVHLDPNSAIAYKSLAIACYNTKQYDRGFELLKKSVGNNPNYAPAVANLGIGYFLKGELYESLIWQLRSSSLAPNNPVTILNIGWTYRLLGDLEKAEKWLIRSIEIKPMRDAYRELGYTYVQQGNEQLAISLIPKVASLESENSRIFEEAGLIALFANETDSAKYYFNRSIELNKNIEDDANTIAPLAIAYYMMNTEQHEEAVAQLQHLEELYLNLINSGSQDDDLRIYLAAVMSIEGNDNEAINWLRMAITSNWIDLAMINHMPWFKSLKANPNYQVTVAELEADLKEMKNKAINLD